MADKIKTLISTKKAIFKDFKIEEDYYVQTMENYSWSIVEREGLNFLSYWDNKTKAEKIIVNKNGEPIVSKTKDYTLVVIIDCVKVAYILENKLLN